jgi:hypothetical protein
MATVFFWLIWPAKSFPANHLEPCLKKTSRPPILGRSQNRIKHRPATTPVHSPPADLPSLFSVWPETHVFTSVLVLLLVLILEFPKFFEDEQEKD